MGDEPSVGSTSSRRSTASSVRSQRSQRSKLSNRSTSSSKSDASQRSELTNRSSSTPKSSKSTLSDGLERIANKSAAANGNDPASVRSARSQKSSTSSASSAQRSTSSRHSSSSKKKKNAPPSALNAHLEKISENQETSVSSSVSSWRKPYESTESSPASSSVSVSSSTSGSSWTSSSSRTSKLSKTSKSSNTIPASNLRITAQKQQAEGVDYLEAGNHAQATALFTQALQSYHSHEGGDEKKFQQALTTLYGYRCEALYQLGAYEASIRDAKSSLECGRLSQPSVGGRPYTSPSRSAALHPDNGEVVRAKVLCLLGHSLLRGGDTEGVAGALGESINAATKALDSAEDLSVAERNYSIHQRAVASAKDTMTKAKNGLSSLGKHETLMKNLVCSSKDYLDDLDDALEISPAFMDWHVAKVKHLIGRRRWFAVANHCEQMAAKAANWDGIFCGDLAGINPFPGIPSLQALDPDFFLEKSKSDKGAPPHLRTLSPMATRDAVFRLPRALLPSYLRALRLEERYEEAVLASTALSEFDVQSKDTRNDNFAENKRFNSEWDKLDCTLKLKEEGDSLFRDAYYDRAVTLYGECLAIDEGSEARGSILRQASSWPVACTTASEAGGKLHAVLHSNRAACFSAMGRHDDAIKESSHAINIHSMYTKALLRRARCYAKTGQEEKATADFNRFIVLVEGTHDPSMAYPPPNHGSSCYFDMPSEVSEQQLSAVKSEMNELGIHTIKIQGGGQNNMQRVAATFERSKNWYKSLCCKKNVMSQVLTQPSRPKDGDITRPRNISKNRINGKRRVSFLSKKATQDPSDPPPQAFHPNPGKPNPPHTNPTLMKSRPAFDHPLDPTTAFDTNIDYYASLGLHHLASDSDIRQSYHKLARVYHPDRNTSTEAGVKFEEIKVAYDILVDVKGKKKEYDKTVSRMLEP